MAMAPAQAATSPKCWRALPTLRKTKTANCISRTGISCSGQNNVIIRTDGTVAPCFPMYPSTFDWGNIDHPKFDQEQLKAMKGTCERHCFSTLNHNLGYCYNDARVIKWVDAGGYQPDERRSEKLRGLRDARLDAVVCRAQGILVGFTGFGCFGVSVLFLEVGGVPFLPGDHGMVGSSQGFLGANGINPFVGRLLVGKTQLIEIGWAHSPGE